jgi:3-oxoacyl-[acyl-carrier-protein] synthase III
MVVIVHNNDSIKAYIAGVTSYLPSCRLTNENLATAFPEWSVDKIYEKTGIRTRYIAGQDESCSTMAINAGKKLFSELNIEACEIDYILLCTQSPDYSLPTTACIVQNELGIPTEAGALDFNLGCSGYVYGLSLAKALIESHQASNVLLITSELYSKYINANDKSVRTLFGDAATATLLKGQPSRVNLIHSFKFGTDGKGAHNLIVPHGGTKTPICDESFIEIEDSSGNKRNPSNLYMNGAEILAFTLKTVPKAVQGILQNASLSSSQVDRVIFHQANKFMLDKLRIKTKFSDDQFLTSYEEYGNTVSSSIPLGIEKAVKSGQLKKNNNLLLCGFGVGYSWAGCVVEWCS